MGLFGGDISGCFVALVGALRALGGEITPPRYGWVDMMKKDVAGVGICGCMTSPLWLENMIRKMRHPKKEVPLLVNSFFLVFISLIN